MLAEINDKRDLMKNVARRKTKLIEQVLKHNSFVTNIFVCEIGRKPEDDIELRYVV